MEGACWSSTAVELFLLFLVRMSSSLSVKQIKAELDRLNIDYSGVCEKRELVEMLGAHQRAPSASTSGSDADNDADLETSLMKITNLLDTLPSALQLLDSKFSETCAPGVRRVNAHHDSAHAS